MLEKPAAVALDALESEEVEEGLEGVTLAVEQPGHGRDLERGLGRPRLRRGTYGGEQAARHFRSRYPERLLDLLERLDLRWRHVVAVDPCELQAEAGQRAPLLARELAGTTADGGQECPEIAGRGRVVGIQPAAEVVAAAALEPSVVLTRAQIERISSGLRSPSAQAT